MSILVRSAKELLRHMFLKLGADDLFDRIRPQSAVKGDYLKAQSRRERFSAIYQNGLWKMSQQDVPGSGEGSSLEATTNLRSALPAMLETLGVETLVDLGCGDFTWMRTLSIKSRYVGVDVVPSVVESNKANFADDRHSFFCLDVAEDELPDGDAILCREVLFHLSFADIKAVLRNCAKKPRRYLLATTDSSTLVNADIRSGDYRRLNLQRPPFSFPPPDRIIEDGAIEKGRVVGIWDWTRLQDAIAR